MPVVVLFIIFVALLVIAVPVSITLGITAVLPSVFDPSFTVGAKYLIRAMFGGLDSFPLLAVPMFVLSGIIMAKGGISKKLFDVFAYFLGKFTAGMPCAVIVTCLFYGAISGSAPDRKILMRGAAKIHTRTETATQKPADTFTASPEAFRILSYLFAP